MSKRDKFNNKNVWFWFLFAANEQTLQEKKKKLKNFPADYVGSFYRNLAEKVDDFVGSDF